MTARVTRAAWAPPAGSLPLRVEAEKIYVIPTRGPVGDGATDIPRYTDNVRNLPKEARAGGVPVEFSMPEGSRQYLQEFSAAEAWSLGLAAMSLASQWIIFTVEQFIAMRRKSQSWTDEEAKALPLRVYIAQVDQNAALLGTYEIEGSGEDVLDALRLLKNEESREQKRGLEQ